MPVNREPTPDEMWRMACDAAVARMRLLLTDAVSEVAEGAVSVDEAVERLLREYPPDEWGIEPWRRALGDDAHLTLNPR